MAIVDFFLLSDIKNHSRYVHSLYFYLYTIVRSVIHQCNHWSVNQETNG